MTVFQEVLSSAGRASSLASGYCLVVSKVITLRAWMAELLEVSEVLHHESLLLASDGSTALLCHEIENSLTILALSCVALLLVPGEALFTDEIATTQLAHHGPTDDGFV